MALCVCMCVGVEGGGGAGNNNVIILSQLFMLLLYRALYNHYFINLL